MEQALNRSAGLYFINTLFLFTIIYIYELQYNINSCSHTKGTCMYLFPPSKYVAMFDSAVAIRYSTVVYYSRNNKEKTNILPSFQTLL